MDRPALYPPNLTPDEYRFFQEIRVSLAFADALDDFGQAVAATDTRHLAAAMTSALGTVRMKRAAMSAQGTARLMRDIRGV